MSAITPILGFAAPSGTGKTTLMEKVIALLTEGGLRVAAIKHGHHPADPDVPGKDTHRFRQAGAETVLFCCPERWFMIQDLKKGEEPTLAEHAARLAGHDLILVEGYKNNDHPKILLHRLGVDLPAGDPGLSHLLAIATDDPSFNSDLPLLPLNDPEAVAEFIRAWHSGEKREPQSA